MNDRSPIEVEPDIDGVSVHMEIDTGASLSLVAEATSNSVIVKIVIP